MAIFNNILIVLIIKKRVEVPDDIRLVIEGHIEGSFAGDKEYSGQALLGAINLHLRSGSIKGEATIDQVWATLTELQFHGGSVVVLSPDEQSDGGFRFKSRHPVLP